MDSKVFLQGFNSKKSVNTSNGLNIALRGKRKLLPTSDVADVISAYDVYREEREKCNIIRLTCQVNAVCSNILFNSITEIISGEGSSNMSFINYGIFNGETDDKVLYDNDKLHYKRPDMNFWKENHVQNAIRDTQLTNHGYIYHCGIDILNNHLLRSNTFKCVCPLSGDPTIGTEEEIYFNTIKDKLRNYAGEQVHDRVYYPVDSGLVSKGNNPINMHLYEYDDLYTYRECIEKRLIKSFEGWVGFYNKAKIKTYLNYGQNSEKSLNLERPIMYLSGGDFVDMYPDRSLYSFVPKYNTYKNRVEKNWNYCLTYPSSSTTKGFDDIIETNNNSLKAIYFNENTIADNGVRQLVIYSIAKHGLVEGDFVNIYMTTKEKQNDTEVNVTRKVIDNAKVTAVADEFIFTVFCSVALSKNWVSFTEEEYREASTSGITLNIDGEDKKFWLYNNVYFSEGANSDEKYYLIDGTFYANFDKDAQHLSYKKVVNDIECEYYVRIFSKIPNFKYASGDTSNEYEIYKNNGELISECQDNKYDFESHVSRLAFAKNAYSDNIGEIVFTDDIDISNLKDNLGRPLSSVYLSIIKNNAGYKNWYGFDVSYGGSGWTVNECTNENVEFSHCFGRITCGLETSEESKYDNTVRSINKIGAINISGFGEPLGLNVDLINGDRDNRNLYPNDDPNYDINSCEVWFWTDKHYYGDLSYYDGYNAVERHLQPILHRFNTAQRESMGTRSNSYFNLFYYDEITNDDYDIGDNYTITSYTKSYCNAKKEGYFYNPHYEIPIKTFDKIETVMPDFLTITKIEMLNDNVRLTSLENHHLSIGDKFIIYDTKKNEYYHGKAISAFGDNYKRFSAVLSDENGNQVHPVEVFCNENDLENKRPKDEFKVFKLDNFNIPSYARILKDGTCRIIWRNILNNGFNISDDTVEEYPFTNGAFYINKSINLYVRRQDPYAIWGLHSTDDIEGNEMDIEKEDNYVKETEIVC